MKKILDTKISAMGVVPDEGANATYMVVLMHVWGEALSEDASQEEILAAGPPLAEADVIFCLN